MVGGEVPMEENYVMSTNYSILNSTDPDNDNVYDRFLTLEFQTYHLRWGGVEYSSSITV